MLSTKAWKNEYWKIAPVTASQSSIDAALLALFAEHGYSRVETSLLQPVDLFLDLSGEDIRRRLYLTQDADGHEMCLRPEYTIPVARAHLAANTTATIAELAYLGPVFRHRPAESGEFIQAGVESFGRMDREAADAQVLSLALDAARSLRLTGPETESPKIRIGDVSLLEALVTALKLPAALQRRLSRALASGKPYREALQAPRAIKSESPGLSAYPGVLTALKGTDGNEARAFVKDLLAIAGISSVGGRSAADIAERFLRQAESQSEALSDEAGGVLEKFLGFEGDPDQVSADIRDLAKAAKLDLDPVLDAYDARIGFMAAQGIDLTMLNMQTRFVRNLDYYTSFIFEIASALPGKPVLGGGRYDRLLARLGADQEVPAVGFAIWLDRVGAPA